MAKKWARVVTTALQARPRDGQPMRVDVIHDPQQSQLKIIAVGSAGDAANLLGLVDIWLDQLKA